MSAKSAALKLNGIFLGFIGNFEKFTDLSPADRIFAEILPESGDFYPLSCVLDENFFKAPPDFCDVYVFEGGAIVQVTAFPARARELKVLRQERMDDALLTLYSEGDLKLSVERQNKFALTVLPREFEDCELSSQKLGGEVFFCASAPADGETELIVFSGTPEKTFVSRVLEYSFTDCLKTKIAYHDPAGHVAETEWAFSNGAFVMRRYSVTAQKTFDLAETNPALVPLLFFNEVLVRGDPSQYLGDALKPRAAELADYLGAFAGVSAPPELFDLQHPGKNAAGLVYPRSANLFEVRFFEVQMQGGLISNICPVED
jgi:hypothetical protein